MGTAVYAIAHSALASRTAKRAVTRLVGERNRNAVYRPLFILQSAAAMAGLMIYIRRQPGRKLYSFTGRAAVPFRLAQAAAVCWACNAAYRVGLSEILGLRPLLQLARSEDSIAPEPEAQGPALQSDGRLNVTGPFQASRHPLNVVPAAVIWLNPRMTTNLLAYNLVATPYLLLGSWLEARRLRAAYGEPYVRYENGPVPFYVPQLFSYMLWPAYVLRLGGRQEPSADPSGEATTTT